MITLSDYFMGRDTKYPAELNDEKRSNALEVVKRATLLMSMMDGVVFEICPASGSWVSSGWRPAEINGSTPNAAPKSNHMTCRAIDIYDPEGTIDDWCMEHLSVLEYVGLWLEHPAATKGWCHLQIVAPKSGKRVFYP